MRTLLALALAAAPAAAQEVSSAPAQAVSTAPAAAAVPALRQGHEQLVRALMKDLALLLEYGPEGRPEKMDSLAAELPKFDEKVREALGKALLERVTAKEKADREAAQAEAARRLLADLRYRLRAYYAAKGGSYPSSPAETGAELPALLLPGHSRPGGLRLIDSRKFDAAPEKAVEDSGGWLYFSNPASPNFGMLLLDCDHKDAAGTEFYRY